eukprot:2858226-Pleurochrysis_carterae.AAC.1
MALVRAYMEGLAESGEWVREEVSPEQPAADEQNADSSDDSPLPGKKKADSSDDSSSREDMPGPAGTKRRAAVERKRRRSAKS